MAENVNITPDMINNIVNMLKNSSNKNESNTTDSNNSNNSNVQNTSDNSRGIFSDFISATNSSTNKSTNTNGIDLDSIMKIKSIMEAMNDKTDAKSNLLFSLKPYLRKSKQAKLDQYVNIMKISQITNLFKNDKGDVK